MAGSEKEITVSELTTEAHFRGVVELQRVIWGFAEADLLPVRFFVVASKVGGSILGAFDQGRLVAFCLAIPAIKPGAKPFLHSNMLGVLAEYRDFGLGRRLKLRQREYALEAGIPLIEWTFDPLELKNAYFNLERLGAIVRRHVRNQYGISTSHLHGGIPTDRLTAEWWVGSERASRICAGEAFAKPPIAERILVPNNIGSFRTSEPARVRAVQEDIAERFENAFRKGLAVVGLERGDESGAYLLAEMEDPSTT
jgi:predicted GNAT superfamily acetyltransferase